MLRVTRGRVLSMTAWSLENHIERIYDTMAYHGGKAPPVFRREGQTRYAVQQSLQDWNADLGARDRMDWRGFLENHRSILGCLANVPRLGRLRDTDVDAVCDVVGKLEDFKPTAARKLVFGSKAAHFHFPWLVPVMSSEVEQGLRVLQQDHERDLTKLLPDTGDWWFRFASPEQRAGSFRSYVSLGNALMRDIDTRDILGRRSPSYDLHAKVFEWWIVSFAS